MTKTANKKIIAIVAVIALVAILGICLVACNSDSVGKKLENKGYSVTKLNEDSEGTIAKTVYGLVKNNSDYREGVGAIKGADIVVVLWFNNKEAATKIANNVLLKAFTVEQNGNIVYVGTEQGVKDAK